MKLGTMLVDVLAAVGGMLRAIPQAIRDLVRGDG